MTQCERIRQYMEDFGGITALEAMRDLGIMRLASRISEMVQAGERITKETVTSKNRYGETTRYARYKKGV